MVNFIDTKIMKIVLDIKKSRKYFQEIDPRVKLLWLLSYVAVFFTNNLNIVVVAFLFSLIFFILTGAARSIYRYAVIIMVIFSGIIGIVYAIRTVTIGETGELLIGFTIILKWLSITLSSVAFFVISSPYEISSAMQSLKVPKIAAFSVGVGFRFLPVVLDEFHKILLSQRARGLGAERGLKILIKLPLVVRSITIPLLRNLFNKMENMWLSLSIKGISAKEYIIQIIQEKKNFTFLDFIMICYSILIILFSFLF